jgi:hypothetical protein
VITVGKGKPRRDPNKKQNLYGSKCSYSEEHNGVGVCEAGIGDWNICKGNPHNCVKVLYKIAASRSDKQKLNEVRINK